jgi:hypothetical protein
MSDTIFLRRGDALTALRRTEFDSEDALQAMLARYPDLLAGEQMNPDDPRRWLLIAREMGVPGAEGGPDRWSLDHLFVDQDAIPTLVEVKRASDTRIRREVAGQMLDYASNAVTYWPIAVLRASFEQTARTRGTDPVRAVAELIRAEANTIDRAGGVGGGDGAGGDPVREAVDGFWSRLETNLQAGRIRMVFVADRIPEELRRIVEFLNRQMHLAEVLAVEIPQFVGEDLQTLVPRVYGMTAEARTRKRTSASAAPAEAWVEADFFPELEANAQPEAAKAARALLEWAKANGRQVDWTAFGFVPVLPVGQKGLYPFHVLANGNVQVYFQYLKSRPPFDQEAKRRELLARLNAIPGVAIAPEAIGGKPSVPLIALASPDNLSRFLDAVNWVRGEVERAI